MPANIVYTGDLPTLENRFLASLKEHAAQAPAAPRLVLCGSHLLGTHLRRQAARDGVALFNVRFHTFDSLAADLLPLDYQRRKLISPLGEMVLLKKIVESQPGYFAPVRDKNGFLRALLEALQDLIDGGVNELPAIVQKTAKLRDLARIFHNFQAAMGPFISRSEVLKIAAQNVAAFQPAFGTESLTAYGFYDFTLLQKNFLGAAVRRLNLTLFLPHRPGDAYQFSEATLQFLKDTGFKQVEAGNSGAENAPGQPASRTDGSLNIGETCNLRRLQIRMFQPLPGSGIGDWGLGAPDRVTGAGGRVTGAGGRRTKAGKPSRIDPPHPASPHPQLQIPGLQPLPDGSVVILSAPDEATEIAELCRQVQDYARQDIDFSEMAVLLRNPEIYVPLILDLFPACGIPCYVQSGIPASQTQPARSLMLLLDLLQSDLPRFQVMEFAAFAPLRWNQLLREGNFVLNEFRISPAAWNRLSARAGIVSGTEVWPQRLSSLSQEIRTRLASSDAESGEPGPRGSLRYTRFELFQTEALAEFIRILDHWKQRFAACRSWGSFAGLTEEAVNCFFRAASPRGLEASGRAAPPDDRPLNGGKTAQAFLNSDARSLDDETWTQLREIIHWVATLDQIEPCRSLQDWTLGLRVALESDRTQLGRFQDGGVNIMSVMGARGTRHRVAFVPGMVEKGFPIPSRQDAILLDRERAEINQAAAGGLPLKSLRPREELLLFDFCVNAAREKLVLSFPRLDVQTSRARLPSHFLIRVAEALSGTSHTYPSMEAIPQVRRIPLAELGPADPSRALTDNQFSLAFMNAPRRIPASLYHSRLRRSLESYHARWSCNFTPYDGFLRSAESLELIRHWADREYFSPSRLETFATCPFKFFLQKLMRLEPLQEPEAILQISALDKGSLVHRILDAFLRAARDGHWLPFRQEHSLDLHKLLETVAAEALKATEQAGVTGYRLLWELDSEQIRADLHRFLDKELEAGDGFVPDQFEVNFQQGSAPLQFELSDGTCLKLTGRMDRIDVNAARTGVRVIDYKTGQARPGREAVFEGGKKLQLPLYLLAAARMYGLPGLGSSLAEYYYVTSAGKFGTHLFTGAALEAKMEELTQLLEILSSAMRRGLFPPTPGKEMQHCKWCDYPRVCDKAEDRIYSFKSRAPQLEFQRRLEEYP